MGRNGGSRTFLLIAAGVFLTAQAFPKQPSHGIYPEKRGRFEVSSGHFLIIMNLGLNTYMKTNIDKITLDWAQIMTLLKSNPLLKDKLYREQVKALVENNQRILDQLQHDFPTNHTHHTTNTSQPHREKRGFISFSTTITILLTIFAPIGIFLLIKKFCPRKQKQTREIVPQEQMKGLIATNMPTWA